MSTLAAALKSQYRSALRMTQDAVERCVDEEWNEPVEGNRFWHMTYHTLFYVALYLSSEESPVLWSGCRMHHHFLSKAESAPEYDPATAYMYGRAELLEFIEWLKLRVEDCFEDASAELPSQFSWISFSRLELHLYNLRHLQHHCGQLSERVKQQSGIGVKWVGRS